MKKYIGTKQVEAEPMTMGEAYEKGLLQAGRVPKESEKDNNGYRVRYEGGYESWSPTEAFEKAYKVADTAIDRMHIEACELAGRYRKLATFIDSGKMNEVVDDEYNKCLLEIQCGIMFDYIRTLETRIQRMQGSDSVEISKMNFGMALQALQAGYVVRRNSWNENLFLIKQVFSHVETPEISSMRSLPIKAKELFLSKANNGLNYDKQLIICDISSGRVNSYIPTMDDMFSEDWSIESYECYCDKSLLRIFRGATQIHDVEDENGNGTNYKREFFNVDEIREKIKGYVDKDWLKQQIKTILKIYYPHLLECNKKNGLDILVRFFLEEDEEIAKEIIKEFSNTDKNSVDEEAINFILKHTTGDCKNFCITAAREDVVSGRVSFTKQQLYSAVCSIYQPSDFQTMFGIIDYILTGDSKFLEEFGNMQDGKDSDKETV